MRLQVCKDDHEWVDAAWTWLHSEVKTGQRVFVPAGGTPTPLYRRWVKDPSAFLHSLRLIQIDEIINGPQRGTFRRFLETEMSPFISQMEFITNADQAADAAILGVGVNGHVAFHEPQLPKNFNGGCVRLSCETLEYLHLDDPTWGVTYGVGSFLQCKNILVMAKGERKQRIIKQALAKKDLPISWILEHPKVTLLTDFSI